MLVLIPERFARASKSRVRRGRASSSRFGGPGLTQAPSHSLSPRPPGASRADAPGPAQTSESPIAPGRTEPPGHNQSRTRPPSGRGVTVRTPGPPRCPGQGRCRASSRTLTRQPLLPVCRSRRLAVTPAACSRGGSGPAPLPRPTPPRVRAALSPDTVRAAATAPFPPSSLSASLPPRPASYFLDPLSARAWHANHQLQVSHRAPSLARHKDGAVGDCRRRSREPSPTAAGGRGTTGKVVN